MSRYPSLFAPSIWGSQRSKPRVDGLNAYRAGGASGRAERLAAFYAERARHGVALIVTGCGSRAIRRGDGRRSGA